MKVDDLPENPNEFSTEDPGATGFRNSSAPEYRDQQQEVNQLLEEETNKVIHHLAAKLPKEVLERLDVMGGLKEKLYDYFKQNYRSMFNRYIASAEDEIKKIHNHIDDEKTKILSRYNPREITDLLDQAGGAGKFNTGEIEKSIVNIYGHLQGHIQQSVSELEKQTNTLLRQKTDTGAFIRGDNAYSIVKCAFKDNPVKPKTVTDVKLSVNILDSELISPIFHHQITAEYLIKDILSRYIIDNIDKEIEKLKEDRLDQGLEELSDTEIIFAKIGKVEDYTDDKADDPQSRRYSIIAKSLFDRIADLRAEIDPDSFDQQNIRENIKKIMDMENIRSRGFNTAVNLITSILDNARLGYQYIENLKNARELLIREYEDTDTDYLPDERYQIRMRYYDNAQLIEERKAYDVQIKRFETEVQRLWDVLNAGYEDAKSSSKVSGYADLSEKNRNCIRRIKKKTGGSLYEDIVLEWDETSFVQAAETEVERMNRTYVHEKDNIRRNLVRLRDKLKAIYDYQYPVKRKIIEDRLNFMEKEYGKFERLVNPCHIQPGLLLDMDITSIKRKKITLDAMTNVLTEFLHGISKGSQDAAFASFSRLSAVPGNADFFSGGGDEAALFTPADPAPGCPGMVNSNRAEDGSAGNGDNISAPDAAVKKSGIETGGGDEMSSGPDKRESCGSGGQNGDAIREV
jgi:hypothetical protein